MSDESVKPKTSKLASALERLVKPTKREKRAAELVARDITTYTSPTFSREGATPNVR